MVCVAINSTIRMFCILGSLSTTSGSIHKQCCSGIEKFYSSLHF